MSMRASELRKFSHFHILKCYFLLYAVGTSDTLSQKHISFQFSNYICMQFLLLLMVWRYAVAAISCSEWGGRNRPSSFGHSSGEQKLATVA